MKIKGCRLWRHCDRAAADINRHAIVEALPRAPPIPMPTKKPTLIEELTEITATDDAVCIGAVGG
jgi:hypothetical protein